MQTNSRLLAIERRSLTQSKTLRALNNAFDTHSLLGLGLVTLRSIGVRGMARNDFQGSLDLLVLKTLAQRGKLHGYGIVLHIQRASEELLRVEEGSLYPALHRMEQSRWINSEWALTETNRRAKYYQLTAVGRKGRPPAVSRTNYGTTVRRSST